MSPARRKALWSSRVELTSRLVAAIADASPAPRVLLSASAVGYYGDRGADLRAAGESEEVGSRTGLGGQLGGRRTFAVVAICNRAPPNRRGGGRRIPMAINSQSG
jgi:hypothetical protein